MRRRSALALLVPLLVTGLTACGSGSGSSARKAAGDLPTAAGDYGSKPTFTFPGPPPATLKKEVLREGKGPVVASGDLLVADYLGQVWQGAVFDNSYDRKSPAGFVIGTGKVIPGWDQVLVGVKAGSRVLMSIPPAQGYGSSGNEQAGIKGTDTLVFVVDVIGSYGKTATGDPKAAVQAAQTAGVTVTGAPGAAPQLAVAKAAAQPKAPALTLLAKGSGAPVGVGLLVVQYVATKYTGEPAGSTYDDGAPAAVPVSAGEGGTPFDLLKGVPLGSRVLLRLPGRPAAQGSPAQPAIAVVADLVAEPKTAAETG
ncbi:MAG: FKBP-type peptidyl-prolyl cis-trans isomerase [Actinobacteria bacterium]|nr:FKBP-type peptidyl-prolyl cis-trans isomerase [Actinomycetota bacterium]MCA1719590.1 FKBP-type peptidyl-prolyl cis-trans isomerase [Actinomycetota bacterium]